MMANRAHAGTMTDFPRVTRVPEVAEVTNARAEVVQRWLREGRFPHAFRAGGGKRSRRLVPHGDVLASCAVRHLRQQKYVPPEEPRTHLNRAVDRIIKVWPRLDDAQRRRVVELLTVERPREGRSLQHNELLTA